MSKKKRKSPWAVFVAIFLAIIFGSWAGTQTHIFNVTLYSIVDVIGTIFLNALTLVVVPLVSSSIITGISRIGNEGGFGRLGGKMFFFYLSTNLLAILIGLFFVNIIQPGNEPIPLGETSIALNEQIASHGSNTFVQLLISIIPPNIVAAFSKGEMLGLIFF